MIKWNNIGFILTISLMSGFVFLLFDWALSPTSTNKEQTIKKIEPPKPIEPPKEESTSKCIIDYMLNGKNHIDTIINSKYIDHESKNCYKFYGTDASNPGSRYLRAIICSEHDIKIVCPD